MNERAPESSFVLAYIKHVGPWLIDSFTKTVLVSGKTVSFSPTESALLVRLAQTPGVVVTYEQLCEAASMSATHKIKAVRNELSRIRIKAGAQAATHIRTFRGKGYCLVTDLAHSPQLLRRMS